MDARLYGDSMKHGIETPEEWRVGDWNHNEIQELRNSMIDAVDSIQQLRDEVAELKEQLEVLRIKAWWHGIR